MTLVPDCHVAGGRRGSVARLEAAGLIGPLLISDAVCAELAIRCDRIKDFDGVLKAAVLVVEASDYSPAALVRLTLVSLRR